MPHILSTDTTEATTLTQAQKNIQSLIQLRHPSYSSCITDWSKYRHIMIGGKLFKDKYLKKYSKREDDEGFANRKDISYTPGHARTCVLEVRNSIFERFVDIERLNGSEKYQAWIKGENGGVDRKGSSLSKFIGNNILEDLLAIGKVAVYVDAPSTPRKTLADDSRIMPYIYVYKAEDILTWAEAEDGTLEAVLLRDYTEDIHTSGLVSGVSERYRFVRRVYDEDKQTYSVVVSLFSSSYETMGEDIVLEIEQIPIHIEDIGSSILCDVADYQIAHMNLASSDMNYAFRANFPIYTEQYDPRGFFGQLQQGGDQYSDEIDGTVAHANEDSAAEIAVDTVKGRAYPKGMDRPDFIHPSSEPMEASMKKQDDIKAEIRQLIMLTISTLSPDTDPTRRDDKGLESGLSFIGMALEAMERNVARFFAAYEKEEPATISYPNDYEIKTDKERREEAEKLLDIMPKIPSTTYQKVISKRVAHLTISNHVDAETITRIEAEIDNAKVIVTDPEVLHKDREAGLVSDATASIARLYPEGEVEEAKKDHAERAARILKAQINISDKGPRGVDDLSNDPDSGIKEKQTTQDASLNEDGNRKVRGEADGIRSN